MLNVNDPILLKQYLVDEGFAPDPGQISLEHLGGGVSNAVIRICTDKSCYILKQALPKLKVEAEWVSDVERANVEKNALGFLPSVIPGLTPGLVHEDEKNFLFVMEAAPSDAVTWKWLLMQKKADVSIARLVGESLGRLHKSTYELDLARQLFGERKYFHQLRIDPFFKYLVNKYPSEAKAIDLHISNTLDAAAVLVSGDFSPKNILVHSEGITLIDFEVMHFGDPSFDLGFICTHLLLKSVFFGEEGYMFVNLMNALLDGYFSVADFMPRSELEKRTAEQVGWLLLARVDGKSPAEYINTPELKASVRELSRVIRNSHTLFPSNGGPLDGPRLDGKRA